MNNIKWVFVGIGVAIAILVSFLIGYKCPKNTPIPPIETRVDTLTIYDTILVTKPVSITRRVVDSVLVPVVDTLRVRDTLFIAMDKEVVVWEDSLSMVYASGIRPSIDSVKHFTQERVITIERDIPYKVKSRWGLGVNVGYGATLNNNAVKLSPYVGLGISYNIISW